MKALVTGSAGFVGSHLAERLLADGHTVVGVDNLVTGRLPNIAGLRGNPNFSFLEADAAQPIDAGADLDAVLHLASPASPPRYLEHPIETLLVNAEGSRHLLDLARQRSATFLLASTS